MSFRIARGLALGRRRLYYSTSSVSAPAPNNSDAESSSSSASSSSLDVSRATPPPPLPDPFPDQPQSSDSELPPLPPTMPTIFTEAHRPRLQPPRLVNPFHTHKFVQSLENAYFTPPVAEIIMRATHDMLVERINKARMAHFGGIEAENEEYLYRAALSELRNELTMRTKNDAATLSTFSSVIRKEVEALSSRMKEDIGTLKHEIQLEMGSRKNEVNSEAKLSAIATEELHHKATVMMSDLRTDIEQTKWEGTRRGVIIISILVMVIIAALETAPKPKKKQKKSYPPPTDMDTQTSKPTPAGHVARDRLQLDLREFEDASEG